jgi:hypothetical protein
MANTKTSFQTGNCLKATEDEMGVRKQKGNVGLYRLKSASSRMMFAK